MDSERKEALPSGASGNGEDPRHGGPVWDLLPPKQLLVAGIAGIFILEFAIMWGFEAFLDLPPFTKPIIDSVVLSALAVPVLYRVLFRPMMLHIRERESAERSLARSEARHRMLLEQAADGILEFDPAGRIVDANAEACRLLHTSREALSGRDMGELFYDAEMQLSPLPRDALDAERIVVEERWVRGEADRSIPVEVRARRMPDGSSQAIVRDITEHKLVQAAIAKSRDYYAKLFEDFPNPVWRSDGTGRGDFFNRAWLEFTGRKLEDELGWGWVDSMHPEDRVVWKQRCGAGEIVQSPFEVEFRLRHRSGDYRWMVCVLRPLLDIGGGPTGFISTCYDITERKAEGDRIRLSQEQLRQLTVAQEQVREEERRRIAREIHDELGQSLTALKIDLALLQGKLRQDKTPVAGEVTRMFTTVDHTIRTVQRLATELRPGILDDLGIVAAIEWQAAEFQKRMGIPCSVRVVDGDEVSVSQELATAVFRTFQETLTNVARHAAASRVDAVLEFDGDSLSLAVSDDGAGIAESRIQDPRSIGISGMRERALAFGGTLQISRNPEGGTRVALTLPLSRGAARP